MKFKEGCLIEVLIGEDHPCNSWYPAEMMSVDDDNYIVKYELILDQKGEHLVERVHKEHVRPRPKHGKKTTWMVGDIAEVFDNHCWRNGKVAKVLKNDSFVIRLFGSIQLKEFHKSSLRIQQTWHNHKWLIVGKDGYNVQTCSNHNSSCSRRLKGPQRVVKEERQSGDQNGRECIKTALNHQAITRKRNKVQYLGQSCADMLLGGSCKKRKTSLNGGTNSTSLKGRLPLLDQVDDTSFPKVKLKKTHVGRSSKTGTQLGKGTINVLHSSFRSNCSSEDSNHCSVDSCSSNEAPNNPSRDFAESAKDMLDGSDAESSSFHRQKPSLSSPLGSLETDIHKLELHAYRSTLHALYASGPLSWEQETLLTNLRFSLNISNDEHLLQLRRLLSSQVLS